MNQAIRLAEIHYVLGSDDLPRPKTPHSVSGKKISKLYEDLRIQATPIVTLCGCGITGRSGAKIIGAMYKAWEALVQTRSEGCM